MYLDKIGIDTWQLWRTVGVPVWLLMDLGCPTCFLFQAQISHTVILPFLHVVWNGRILKSIHGGNTSFQIHKRSAKVKSCLWSYADNVYHYKWRTFSRDLWEIVLLHTLIIIFFADFLFSGSFNDFWRIQNWFYTVLTANAWNPSWPEIFQIQISTYILDSKR